MRSAGPCKALTLSAVLAVVGMLASCGGDDAETSPAQRQEEVVAAESDERVVARLAESMQDRFLAGDGRALCGSLTAAGRAEVLKILGSGDASCAAVIRRVSALTRDSGVEQRRAEVVSVKIDGRRATAMLKDPGRPPQPIRMVERDGGWKIVSPGLARAVRSAPPVEPAR